LAGYGIRLSSGINSFLTLINKLKIPVLTTWKAADIMPDNHPLFMGRPGIAGQRAANFIQQNSDLFIAMGARLDFPQTGFDQSLFAREATKVIIDIDLPELKKFGFFVDYPICTNIGLIINTLLERNLQINEKTEWLQQCKYWKNAYPVVLPEQYAKKNYASLYVLIKAISDMLSKDDIIVPGSSGMGSDVSYQIMEIKEGQRMLNSPGFGSMGFGIPSALGACIASGNKRTICINGDGGFQMNIQDLETIINKKLPIKFFVLNNQGYGSIRNTQRNYFNSFFVGSSFESGLSLPDIKLVGKAYGYAVFSIYNNKKIKKVVAQALNSNGPVICEVLLDPYETLSLRATSFIHHDGTSTTIPMEDLYPFLPRKEFYKNMYIKPINKTGINICNILFDLDGTIIDSKPGITASMKYAFEKNGIDSISEELIKETIGLSLKDSVYKIIPNISDTKLKDIIITYRKHYSKNGIFGSVLYEDIEKAIPCLAEEYNLHVVTSKFLSTAKKILLHFGLADYFVDIKGIESDFNPKSKAQLIQVLIREKDLNPDKTIMIGERGEDINAATENNIKANAVSYGFGTREEIGSAYLILESIKELTETLL
jgi:phosphoglycolate phosphatase-like HAD superfamily hydrolase